MDCSQDQKQYVRGWRIKRRWWLCDWPMLRYAWVYLPNESRMLNISMRKLWSQYAWQVLSRALQNIQWLLLTQLQRSGRRRLSRWVRSLVQRPRSYQGQLQKAPR